jgi:hypothetical protein
MSYPTAGAEREVRIASRYARITDWLDWQRPYRLGVLLVLPPDPVRREIDELRAKYDPRSHAFVGVRPARAPLARRAGVRRLPTRCTIQGQEFLQNRCRHPGEVPDRQHAKVQAPVELGFAHRTIFGLEGQ